MRNRIRLRTRAARYGLAMGLAALTLTASARAAVVVNDSWADGGRTNGADAQDANWWGSTSASAIEVSTNNLGLISGTSGRGIHGTFAPQALAVGDRLTVTFTFTTPATVTTAGTTSSNFRIGLFNRSNNAALEADLTASSGSPNALYNPLSGYMMDYDVNTSEANINFREKDPVPGTTGQLLSTTTGYVGLGGGGDVYSFLPNTQYTGVYSIERTADGVTLAGSISLGSSSASPVSTFTTTDDNGTTSTTTFDMVAFHVNSNTFGSTTTAGHADNGINFSNITIDVSAVPEPGVALIGLGFAGLALRRAHRA